MGNHAGGQLNMQAQADAYTAFFEAAYSQPWFKGAFFWDWETNPHQGGRCDGGAFSFTPAGKLAEQVPGHFPRIIRLFFALPIVLLTVKCSHQVMAKYFIGGSSKALVGTANTLHGGAAGVLSVYTDGKLAQGWSDYSYNGHTDLENTAQLYMNDSYRCAVIPTYQAVTHCGVGTRTAQWATSQTGARCRSTTTAASRARRLRRLGRTPPSASRCTRRRCRQTKFNSRCTARPIPTTRSHRNF